LFSSVIDSVLNVFVALFRYAIHYPAQSYTVCVDIGVISGFDGL